MPLCTIRIQLKPPIEVGAGPADTRMIFELASAEAKADRLAGALLGAAAADWAVLGPDGTGMLDVRWTLRTEDGAAILIQYRGRLERLPGPAVPDGGLRRPRFETGDQSYAWLNRIQAVGKGIVVHEDLSLDYEWYQVC